MSCTRVCWRLTLCSRETVQNQQQACQVGSLPLAPQAPSVPALLSAWLLTVWADPQHLLPLFSQSPLTCFCAGHLNVLIRTERLVRAEPCFISLGVAHVAETSQQTGRDCKLYYASKAFSLKPPAYLLPVFKHAG